MPFKSTGKTNDYIRMLVSDEDDALLNEMQQYADEHFIPILLPESCAFLKQIVMLLRPKKCLEIGTAIGYSAQLILRNGGEKLYTIEKNEDVLSKAKEYFARAGLTERVVFYLGDAGEILPMIDGEYDFIFMDGPKTKYIEYFPHLKRLLKQGGVMLCDNVLYNGMVAGEAEYKRKKATIVNGLDKFLGALTSDKGLVTSILPVGDGMSLSICKEKNK